MRIWIIIGKSQIKESKTKKLSNFTNKGEINTISKANPLKNKKIKNDYQIK